MDRKLVKEIITTETEKFTEDGNIKERVKEIKEKIYSSGFVPWNDTFGNSLRPRIILF